MQNLLEIARMACDVARREGVEFVDVVASRGRSIRVELEKGAIKSSDARWNFGVSIRAFVKGGLGSSSSSGTFVEADIINAAKHAAELAKAADPDPDFVSLPEPAMYQEVAGLYDEKIAQLKVKEIIKYATSNIDSALSVRQDAIISGGSSSGFGESALVNSLEIIKDTAEGLYINMGNLSPNSVTGELSATVDFGFKIENGELAYPIKSCLIGANMIELMKSIDAISKDYREEPGMIMPTIRAQNVQVAGGR